MSANAVGGPRGGGSLPPPGPGPHLSFDDLSFGDVLRAINPLQYLPVIGTIYRVATGDTGSSGLRTAVSTAAGLMGGPIGFFSSIVGSLIENFFHVEDTVRMALAPAGRPADPPVGTAARIPDVAPALEAGSASGDPVAAPAAAIGAARVVSAYQAAGLLGAV